GLKNDAGLSDSNILWDIDAVAGGWEKRNSVGEADAASDLSRAWPSLLSIPWEVESSFESEGNVMRSASESWGGGGVTLWGSSSTGCGVSFSGVETCSDISRSVSAGAGKKGFGGSSWEGAEPIGIAKGEG